MGNLQRVLYSPLKEEAVNDHTGWQKDTVEYAYNNKHAVVSSIQHVASGIRKKPLQRQDIEDIYQDVMLYLYNAEDYNINKAIEHASGNGCISVEGYVNICVKYCVHKALSKLHQSDLELSTSILGNDDNETSIFDTLADPGANTEACIEDISLEDICKSCEPLRYRFGADLYMVTYIGLLCKYKNTNKNYKDILSMLGVSSKDLSTMSQANDDAVIISMMHAVLLEPYSEALRILEEYVYSAGKIKNLINLYS